MIEAKANRVKISGKCPLCGSEIKETETDQIEKRQNEGKRCRIEKFHKPSILLE